MDVDEIIARVKARANGRTVAMNEEPRLDEVLVAEVEKLRAAVKALADLWLCECWARFCHVCENHCWARFCHVCENHPVIDEVAAKGVNHETTT